MNWYHPLYRRLALTLACLALCSGPTLAQVINIEVSVDRSPTSVRLVLTHSEPVIYAVRTEGPKLEIHYAPKHGAWSNMRRSNSVRWVDNA